MKKIIAILLLIVFVFSLSGCSPQTYTIQAQEVSDRVATFTLNELLQNQSDTVIVGKVKNSTPVISIYENSNRKYEPSMLNEVEVVEVISGNLKKGDIVTVHELGDGSVFIYRSYEQFGGYLKKDDYAILLLRKGTESEHNYVVQGEKTYRENDCTYVIEAASEVKALKTYYTTHRCQGRIWLTEDKQIDQERNEGLLGFSLFHKDQYGEVIKPGETYEDFVARLKDIIADISAAE